MAFQRNTKQRQIVLEELRKLDSHPTASDLYDNVRRRMPRISLGTVYRNLELMAGMGLVRKLEIGGGGSRFDGNPAHHHHVRCVECQCVDDVHDLPGDPEKNAHGELDGYRILGYHLEFFGICPRCREQRRVNEGATEREKEE